MNDRGLFLARLFLGIPFILWGAMKLMGGAAALVPGLAAIGLPDPLFFAYLIGLCELVGGVAIVLGYPVRTVGILLGLWCLATAKQAHMGNLTEILKNATMAGGFFLIAATGAGSLSFFRGTPPGPLARLR